MGHVELVEVTGMGPADIETAGAVLARAFQDDPVFSWIAPKPSRREEILPPLFTTFASYFVRHEESYLAGAGAALWAPAGVEPIPHDELEVFGARVAEILGDDMERAGVLQELMEEAHPKEPSFYLQFLGVAPEDQGRGIGTRLLRSVLDRCDRTEVPAYLEATSPDNRRLYERHGFETTGEISAPGGPPLWAMWREPRTSPPSTTH